VIDINAMYNFTDKTVLITGASSGLGAQFATCFSQMGAKVIIAARSVNKLHDLASTSQNVSVTPIDVTDRDSVRNVFQHFSQCGEKIDICINNAAILKPTKIFDEVTNDDFSHMMQTNVVGLWYVTKYAANHMKDNKISG
jgi:NADP-dependent 3-hydroxy acid dehydrogenase YdfG